MNINHIFGILHGIAAVTIAIHAYQKGVSKVAAFWILITGLNWAIYTFTK